MGFNNWLDTLIEEKGFDLEDTFEVEGPSGVNVMPYGVVAEAMKSAPANEKAVIKNTLVRIDFANGDCLDFFRHLGKALAI